MSYATAEDMIKRFSLVELVNLAPLEMQGEYDAQKVTIALADSESEINSYLSTRYTVPLDSPPEIIESACCDLARYRLYASHTTEEVQQRYKDRIKWLISVAKGEASLGISEQTATKSAGKLVTSAQDRTFTRDTLAGY